MSSEPVPQQLIVYLRALVQKVIDAKLVGLPTLPSYQRVKQCNIPQLRELLASREAESALSGKPPETCSKCDKPVALTDLSKHCPHEAICKNCASLRKACSVCGSGEVCVECGRNGWLEKLGFGKMVHRECFVAVAARQTTPLIVINDFEVPDSTVFRLLSQHPDLLTSYKRASGLLVHFTCPYTSGDAGEIDISQAEVQCPQCQQDMVTLRHTAWDLGRYRAVRRAVQGLVEAEVKVMQCPYCFAPARLLSQEASIICPICQGSFCSLCCCMTLPLAVHGKSFHRPGCPSFQQWDKWEGRCEECPKNGEHISPRNLLVERRFLMSEMGKE